MHNLDTLFTWLGLAVVLAPAALLAVLGGAALVGLPLSEQVTSRLTQWAVGCGASAAAVLAGLMLLSNRQQVAVEIGNWVAIPEQHFYFHLKLDFNGLTLPFALLSFLLLGVIGAFASPYLHREPGYRRFFLLYAIFFLGMIVAALAGTIETMLVGWELAGLSSVLLVAFFHERHAPVRNGMRVWSVYRVTDVALLLAVLALHHLSGGGDLERLTATGGGEMQQTLTPNQVLVIGLLLMIAAAGKSALVPFSGWLPRAMEGPTPSSAIFYGALSVHLGVFLLLRVGPPLERSFLLSAVMVLWGVTTALYGAICARVQTDIKSAIAFATITQVGLIVVEIGMGLYSLALLHLIGHACLRTLQLVRAPSLLHDYRLLENAIGLSPSANVSARRHGRLSAVRVAMWRLGSERGHLETILNDAVVQPFLAFFHRCDRWERRWSAWVAGDSRRDGAAVAWDNERSEFVRSELASRDEADLAGLTSWDDARRWAMNAAERPDGSSQFPRLPLQGHPIES